MTYNAKLACHINFLQAYRNGLPPGDPDIPQTDAILNYRNVDLANYEAYILSKRKTGLPAGGLDTPPPPPTP